MNENPPAKEDAATSPTRVLLVENDPVELELIKGFVEESQQDFELECVQTMTDALERLRGGGIDLVLLDISLPDLSPSEIFAKLHAEVPGLPVIVLSGLDDEAQAVATVHQGAQDYLVKGRMDGHSLGRAICYAIERQQAEQVLSKERNLLRNIVDHLPDYIYYKDAVGRYMIDNAAHTRFLKAEKPEDVIGKTVFDFFPPEIAALYDEDDAAITRSRQPLINREEPTINERGERRWLSTTKVPLWGPGGEPEGMVCIGRDITERKVAEEKLRDANIELARTVADLNQANENLRAAQLQLIQAEKMQSVGRLAAGIAHEVKNPLAIMSMGLDYLSTLSYESEKEVPAILADMKDGVKRADAVIRELLDFSASRELDLVDVPIEAVIDQSLSLVKHALASPPVSVTKRIAPDLPLVRIDKMKIEQVFVNAFINASHAMPQGGRITITAEAKTLGADDVLREAGNRSGECLREGQHVLVIYIDDSGHGVPEEKLAKIFDPFFTTKPTGKGTGLGLTVTRKIIELHGGSIDIANRAESGARVTIMLRA